MSGIDTMNPSPQQPIIRVSGLRVEFETDDGVVAGVKDVSFEIAPGETLCVVGESGSGKSVTSLSILRLIEFGGGRIAGGAFCGCAMQQREQCAVLFRSQ